MASAKPGGLHFLVSTGVEEPDREQRRFIRRHVMLGPDASPPISGATNIGGVLAESLASPSAPSDPNLPISVPVNFGYYTSSIQFPDAVEPSAVEIVVQFSSIAKQVLFSLESCMLFKKNEMWIASLTLDSAFLHTMIFISSSYYDHIAPYKASIAQATFQHFIRALELLRERIGFEDDQTRLSDTTLAAIMSITAHALLSQDCKSARYHIEGLYRIISLRGGIVSFQRNMKLLIEILRCDLGLALHTGSRPVFSRDILFLVSSTQHPNLEISLLLRDISALDCPFSQIDFLDEVDDELNRIWKVMSNFCSVVNVALDAKQYIPMEMFGDIMAFVMYRLIDIRFASGCSNEATRCGLLAFSTSIFLPWKLFGLHYAHFTSEFRSCLASLASLRSEPRFLLWFLMVGAVSVIDTAGDVWLEQSLAATMNLCEVGSWSEVKGLLESFMWVGRVQDGPAKIIVDAILG